MSEQMYIIGRMEEALSLPLVPESELAQRIDLMISGRLRDSLTARALIPILLHNEVREMHIRLRDENILSVFAGTRIVITVESSQGINRILQQICLHRAEALWLRDKLVDLLHSDMSRATAE